MPPSSMLAERRRIKEEEEEEENEEEEEEYLKGCFPLAGIRYLESSGNVNILAHKFPRHELDTRGGGGTREGQQGG